MRIYRSILKERQIDSNSKFAERLLKKNKSKLIGQDLGNLELEDILNKIFIGTGVRFERGIRDESVRDDFSEAGLIRAYIEENGAIVIDYDNDFYRVFESDDYYYQRFIDTVCLMISHELVHRHQIRKMKSKLGYVKGVDMSSNDKYLSNPMEMQAFAREAVEDFYRKGYKKAQILQLIRTPSGSNKSQASANESNPFWYYYDFYFNDDKPLWNKFVKYIYEFLHDRRN